MKDVRVRAKVAANGLIVFVGQGRRERQLFYSAKDLRPFTDAAVAVPHLTELLQFFLAYYAADRLVKRSRRLWARRFIIDFPVTDVGKWKSTEEDLIKLIRRSTGDDVVLQLAERAGHERHLDDRIIHFTLEEPRPTSVVLLSDGLDSLCGAFQHLKARPQERIAFVSLVTNSRKGARIKKVREALAAARPNDVTFRQAELHLCDPPRAQDQEQTQRSRTMLAIVAGLTVAAAYEARNVNVSENGLGILNLPVPGLQLVHHSSQVLHPANVPLWKRVAKALLGGGEVIYPNRFRTKVEMCADLPEIAHFLIEHTSSCDRPDFYDENDSCGWCGSCIVRKMSLALSRLRQFDLKYSGRPNDQRRAPDFPPATVQHYHAQLISEALAQRDPWTALLDRHPTLRMVADDEGRDDAPHLKSSTLALLQRHVKEVNAFHEYSHAV